MTSRLKQLEKNYQERPRNARLLGIDFGLKRIGLAICGDSQDYATALLTIKRSSFQEDAQRLIAIIKEYEIKGLLFGWPLNLDGTEGPMCDRVRSFADELMKRCECAEEINWISVFDERLSTQNVEEFLIKSVNMSRKKRGQVIDKLAAQRILQRGLDRIKSLEGG